MDVHKPLIPASGKTKLPASTDTHTWVHIHTPHTTHTFKKILKKIIKMYFKHFSLFLFWPNDIIFMEGGYSSSWLRATVAESYCEVDDHEEHWTLG